MGDEENTGRQPDKPRVRSTSWFTIMIAFALGIAAQRSGGVDFVAEEVRDVPRPDFDECVDSIMDASNGQSAFDQQVSLVRYSFCGEVGNEAEDIVSDSVIAVCEKVAEHGIEDVKRYFARVVKNAAFDVYETKSPFMFDEGLLNRRCALGTDPEVTAERREQIELFKNCCEQRMNPHECGFLKSVAKTRLLNGEVSWEKIGAKLEKPLSARRAHHAYNAIMEKLHNTCKGLDESFFK